MFKKHSFQVKLVKDNKKSETCEDAVSAPNLLDYVPIVREIGKDAVIGAGALIGSYVVLDTLRQVTLQIVKAKL